MISSSFSMALSEYLLEAVDEVQQWEEKAANQNSNLAKFGDKQGRGLREEVYHQDLGLSKVDICFLLLLFVLKGHTCGIWKSPG